MQNTAAVDPASSAANAMIRSAPSVANFLAERSELACADHQFIALLDAYRRSGGLARAQEVLASVQRCKPGRIVALASAIVNKEVICFDWQSKMWLPLFQFDSFDMTPQPGLDQVLAALRPGYETWQLAQWFVQPNPWLNGETPADTLLSDLVAVLHAAHADPLVVRH